MPRVSPDVFVGEELAAVFLAETVEEARQAEALLNEHGVNYVVRAQPFGYSLLGSTLMGAVFYVQTSQVEYCGAQLVAGGLGLGVLIDIP